MENLNQNPAQNEINGGEKSQLPDYTPDSLRGFMQKARDNRKHADKVNAGTKGSSSYVLDEMTEKTFNEANKLYEQNTDWINSKLDSIRQSFPEIEDDKVKQNFLDGLRLHIRRIYRTYKKDSPDNLDELNDLQCLRDLIAAYTAEYILLLRQAQKTTESPNMVLAIAKTAHFLTISDCKSLVSKYAELKDSTINIAIINHSTGPEAFLDNVIAAITRLMEDERYANLGDSTINTAAIYHPTGPEAFLDNVLETIAKLKNDNRYRRLKGNIINVAAISHPTNPEAFLNKVLETITKLRNDDRYCSLEDWIINKAATNYPTNPKAYLNKVLKNITKLRNNDKYRELKDKIINVAVVCHPTDSEAFLDKALISKAKHRL